MFDFFYKNDWIELPPSAEPGRKSYPRLSPVPPKADTYTTLWQMKLNVFICRVNFCWTVREHFFFVIEKKTAKKRLIEFIFSFVFFEMFSKCFPNVFQILLGNCLINTFVFIHDMISWYEFGWINREHLFFVIFNLCVC